MLEIDFSGRGKAARGADFFNALLAEALACVRGGAHADYLRKIRPPKGE